MPAMKTTSYKNAMIVAYCVIAVSIYCMGGTLATSSLAGLILFIPLLPAIWLLAKIAHAADQATEPIDDPELEAEAPDIETTDNTAQIDKEILDDI